MPQARRPPSRQYTGVLPSLPRSWGVGTQGRLHPVLPVCGARTELVTVGGGNREDRGGVR